MGKLRNPPPATCTMEGCERPHMARGLCSAHYQSARKAGTLLLIREVPEDVRFDQRWTLDPDSGCHVWTEGTDSSGYGLFHIIGQRSPVRAYVYAWTRQQGRSPEAGMVLDHFACDNKACCNPHHLREVPSVANMTRVRGGDYIPEALAPRRENHCIHGHEWTPENTYIYVTRGGHKRRVCRACAHIRAVRQGVRDREARHARGLRQHSSQPRRSL